MSTSCSVKSKDGGVLLTKVNVVPVFWTKDVDKAIQDGISTFFQTILASGYYCGLSEYDEKGADGGVQHIVPGTVAGSVVLAPGEVGTTLSSVQIATELTAQINSHVLPGPDANTLYMVYFPKGITLTGIGDDGGTTQSCAAGGFCGYHTRFSYNGQDAYFAVVVDFSDPSCLCRGATTVFEDVTIVSTHELVEAVTDPDTYSGWNDPNQNPGEIGDLCNWEEVTVGAYQVSQYWSNKGKSCGGGSMSSGCGASTTPPPSACDSSTPPYSWSCHGPIAGQNCMNIANGSDPDGWTSNYLCVDPNAPSGATWLRYYSGDGRAPVALPPHTGAESFYTACAEDCVQLGAAREPASHNWSSTYLCTYRARNPNCQLGSALYYQWSTSGPVAGQTCLRINVPSDRDGWDTTYLCWVLG